MKTRVLSLCGVLLVAVCPLAAQPPAEPRQYRVDDVLKKLDALEKQQKSLMVYFLDKLAEQEVENPKAPAPHRVSALNRVIGKVLEWCVAAGMTPDQVEAIFGHAEASVSEAHGLPPYSHTSVTWLYSRYGVTVIFHDPPQQKGTPVRVDGEIQ